MNFDRQILRPEIMRGNPLLSIVLILRYVFAVEIMLAELRPEISHLFIKIASDAGYSVFVTSDRFPVR